MIRLSATRTITTALSSIDAVTRAVGSGADSVAYLAEAGAEHAKHYRDTTRKSLEFSTEAFTDIAQQEARHRVARKLLALDQEAKDPEFAEVLERVTIGQTTEKPALKAVKPTSTSEQEAA